VANIHAGTKPMAQRVNCDIELLVNQLDMQRSRFGRRLARV
jgi:hypothetical protein